MRQTFGPAVGPWLDFLWARASRRTADSADYPYIPGNTKLVRWGEAILAANPGMKKAEWVTRMMEEHGEFVQAVAETSKISPRMLLDNLFTEAKNHLSKGIYKKYPQLRKQLPSTIQTAVELFHEGQDGRDWYSKVYPLMQDVFGDDADLMIDFLAATSPQTTPDKNLAAALLAYEQYKNGEPFDIKTYSMFGNHIAVPNLINAVWGKDLKGAKVWNFARALKGDKSAVVVDRWMSRLFLGAESPSNDREYMFVEQLVREAARAAGKYPGDVTHEDLLDYAAAQARIWSALKHRTPMKRYQDTGSYDAFLSKRMTEAFERRPGFWAPFIERMTSREPERMTASFHLAGEHSGPPKNKESLS
jgi:hypothetical protein